MPSKITIEAVDVTALKLALQRIADRSMGYGLTSVCYEIDDEDVWLTFTVERYAMNGNGMHVGTEAFTASMRVFDGKDLGVLNAATPNDIHVVIPRTMDIEEIVPAEEPHEYTVDEAVEYLKEWFIDEFVNFNEWLEDMDKETIMDEAFDRGMGEGDYTQPDEDFAWQELEYHLNLALDDLPEGQFDPQTGKWSIVFKDGEVAVQYQPISRPGVKYVV